MMTIGDDVVVTEIDDVDGPFTVNATITGTEYVGRRMAVCVRLNDGKRIGSQVWCYGHEYIPTNVVNRMVAL